MSITPVWITGFEHGLATPSVSGGGLCTTVTGTPEIQGTTKRTGAFALKCAITTVATAAIVKTITSGADIILRFYYYWDADPEQIEEILRISGTGTAIYMYYHSAAGLDKFRLSASGATTLYSANTYTAGSWYRIDIHLDGTNKTVDWQIDGVAQTQMTAFTTAGEYTLIRFGTPDVATSGTYTQYYDDVVVSETIADYPIGASSAEGLRPDADGAHSFGANEMEDIAGADIGANNTAFALLDDNPFGTSANTDLICQNTANASAYCEVTFPDTTYANINGVMAVLQYCGQNATADEGACYILHANNVVAATVWGNNATRSDYSETTPFYKSAILAAPANGWTGADVNGLKARIGHSNDVVAVPYWLALILEVDGNGTGAAANNYTLECDGVALTGTGSAADLLSKWLVDPATGVHTTAGQDPALLMAALVDPAKGVHATAGIDADLLGGFKVDPQKEDYVLTGVAPALIRRDYAVMLRWTR